MRLNVHQRQRVLRCNGIVSKETLGQIDGLGRQRQERHLDTACAARVVDEATLGDGDVLGPNGGNDDG